MAVIADQQHALELYFESLLGTAGDGRADSVAAQSVVHPAPRPAFQGFRAAGVALAVPTQRVSGMVPWQAPGGREETEVGECQWAGQSIPVVNMARLVVRESHPAYASLTDSANIGHVLVIDGTWGMGCQGTEELTALADHQIKWRKARDDRPWLAGLFPGQGRAVIDVDAVLREMIQ